MKTPFSRFLVPWLVALGLLINSTAFGQTAKTRAALYTDITTNLASGTAITAAQMRTMFQNVVASADNTLTDGVVLYSTGTTSFGRGLLAEVSASTIKTTLSLNNVANVDSTNAANLSSGLIAPARMGTGSGGATKFLREDNTFQTIPGGGDALTASSLAQFAATTSAQLAGVLSDETGSGGGFVRATSPTLVTPVLGAATATSINGLTLTSSTGTFTLTNAKVFSVSNTLTLAGTDGSTLNVGTGGTLGSGAFAAALNTTTVSAGAGDVGKAALLDAAGHFDISTFPIVSVAKGGTGTTSPALVAGTNVTITGSWPNQTINSSGSGGGGDLVATLVNTPLTKTADYTVLAGDYGTVIHCNPTSANMTLTLPAVSGNTNKMLLAIVDATATKLVTLHGNSAENIDGQNTRILQKGESALLQVTSTQHVKLAGITIPMVCLMAPSGTTSVASGAAVKIGLNTTVVDTSGTMADTGNTRVNIARPGNYLVAAYVRASSLNTNCARWISATYKNASFSNFFTQAECAGLTGSFCGVTAPVVVPLVAGDFLELNAFQTSGSGQTAGGTGTTEDTNLLVIEQPKW